METQEEKYICECLPEMQELGCPAYADGNCIHHLDYNKKNRKPIESNSEIDYYSKTNHWDETYTVTTKKGWFSREYHTVYKMIDAFGVINKEEGKAILCTFNLQLTFDEMITGKYICKQNNEWHGKTLCSLENNVPLIAIGETIEEVIITISKMIKMYNVL